MRFSIPAVICCILVSRICYAQSNSRILSKRETDSIFAQLEYPAFRVWQYTDKGGSHYLLLLEKSRPVGPKDTITTNISAFCVMMEKDKPFLRWKMKDNVEADERSIWFWTKYIDPKDIDGDGYIDPLIVYGSSPDNDKGERRRLKMLLYYRHRKIAVRAVDGTLDFERSLRYDPAFQTLPASIQHYMQDLLKRIAKDQEFILAG